VIGVDLESSAGGNTTLCKVAFLTKETYSPANVIQPEQISSNGFTVIELGWFFDASVTQLAKPVGCFNLTGDDYDVKPNDVTPLNEHTMGQKTMDQNKPKPTADTRQTQTLQRSFASEQDDKRSVAPRKLDTKSESSFVPIYNRYSSLQLSD